METPDHAGLRNRLAGLPPFPFNALRLKPLREALPAEIAYEQIRLVVAYVRSSAESPVR